MSSVKAHIKEDLGGRDSQKVWISERCALQKYAIEHNKISYKNNSGGNMTTGVHLEA